MKDNEVGGACGTHGRGQSSLQCFGGKPERKGPLGNPRRRWDEWIGLDPREIDSGGGLSGFNWLRIGTAGGLL
jgi:hypothetical protein